MPSYDPSAPTPRQYRPTYEYVPYIPKAMATSSGPFHIFPPSPPRINNNKSKGKKDYEKEAPQTRRRTTSTFQRPDPGHSAPTVAKSGLTASASVGDLSQPSPKPQRQRFAQFRRTTPTRIPSPIIDRSPPPPVPPLPDIATISNLEAKRFVSTPVLPSQKKHKNAEPKTHRLLRPISPSNIQPAQQMPKSRTLSMLSNITSTFSRSNLNLSNASKSSFSRSTANLTSSREASSSSRTSDPITSVNSTSTPPLPVFTTNARQIIHAMPNGYWCGRFQALHDRFHLHNLEVTRLPQDEFRDVVGLKKEGDYAAKFKDKVKSKVKKSSESEGPWSPIGKKFQMESEERRCRRVFNHLEALCLTDEAKKSLWEFQQNYARHVGCDRLLPVGATMKDGWMSRMGRAISGTSANGPGTSLGRRSGLSAFGRRKGHAVEQ